MDRLVGLWPWIIILSLLLIKYFLSMKSSTIRLWLNECDGAQWFAWGLGIVFECRSRQEYLHREWLVVRWWRGSEREEKYEGLVVRVIEKGRKWDFVHLLGQIEEQLRSVWSFRLRWDGRVGLKDIFKIGSCLVNIDLN